VVIIGILIPERPLGGDSLLINLNRQRRIERFYDILDLRSINRKIKAMLVNDLLESHGS